MDSATKFISTRYGCGIYTASSVVNTAIDWVATHRRHHAYADTYGDPGWVAGHGWDLRPYTAVLERAWRTGEWSG